MKRLMRMLGYEPIRKQTEFQLFILRALKEMSVREVAERVDCSLPTVQRWASGIACPHPLMQSGIVKSLEPEVKRREDELYMKIFGHPKHQK